ncbi:response regulator [Winogradskyella alexanderae]|uniref:Response regulator transcription factor n=1 Tax=Winogradskyella alexanderae TaxID=2877123 RepID=A0ABS7XNF4_9FLAO|nr:response regulator transcription factor [Winogradskyella alexanderae]MCA0131024.1 response regulator transcription factor [Winogradskyella alexanderae]
MKPAIVIADDHPLVLKGLTDFLTEKKYNLIASANNGKVALSLIKAHQPDIAILDIKMPFYTGLEIAQKCKESNLPTKIILITLEKEESTYKEAKNLGIYGYVLKEFALEEIENCIASVVNGHAYFSPELIAYIKRDDTPKQLKNLTPTELKILKRISKNKTAKEIGEELCCSPRTVEKHKSHIIRKLNISKTPNSLLKWAKEHQKHLA